MTGNEYKDFAMRTNDKKSAARLSKSIKSLEYQGFCDVGEVIHACFGLSGEVGELNDMVKKWIFHEKQLDKDHAKKEVGDILWYIALICNAFGWSLDDVMQCNVDKLKARYPDGFDTHRANNRNPEDV